MKQPFREARPPGASTNVAMDPVGTASDLGAQPAGPDADGPWDRIADLLVELALTYDPSILEPIDRVDP